MALRVLLADDEKEFVETLAERLDLRGIEVRVALDGKAALTALDEMAAAEALPDVMVVDLLMPGMTGDAVLQQVRQKYPGLPVIVLTGHDSVDDSGDSPVASAFACLTKPLSLGMFLETLESAARSGGNGADLGRRA
ncbi:response regulator [uncultured Desulfovibrio sp.]|uniref:response regulator n=1 Tax=uncultured Desulfovibrio sp. TaxID=167968 RepID=UPI00265CA5B9|nr:response regulator [uncultured Desulfovibrio sp.]